MKKYFKLILLLFAVSFLHMFCFGQKLKQGSIRSGIAILKIIIVLGPKVVIKGDSIAIYTTKKLAENRTFTKEGDVIDRGIILKHKFGKWIISKKQKDIYSKQIVAGPAIIDFTKKILDVLKTLFHQYSLLWF